MGTYDGDDFADLPSESRIREVAQEELFSQANSFKTAWEDIVIEEWFNDGEAANDITITPPREGADSYTVGGDVIQLLIAEFGRRPGATMPPEQPIVEWVNEQAEMPSRGDDDFDSVVFLVRRAIGENGIEPIMPARRAWDQVDGEYEERVADRLSDE